MSRIDRTLRSHGNVSAAARAARRLVGSKSRASSSANRACVGDEAPEVDSLPPQLELPRGSEHISVCWDAVSIHVSLTEARPRLMRSGALRRPRHDRLTDLPFVTEGIEDPAHSPAVFFANRGLSARTGGHGSREY